MNVLHITDGKFYMMCVLAQSLKKSFEVNKEKQTLECKGLSGQPQEWYRTI